MHAKEAIASQFYLAYRTVAMNTEGMSHADSLRQSSPGGNCANWILGHLTMVQSELLNFLGFHQSYHAGQIGLSRRLAGLDGVIASPAERARATD